MAPAHIVVRQMDFVPPFSNTGISEWHLPLHGENAARFPPFSNTGISEWHPKTGATGGQNTTRHSVTQASASGTKGISESVQSLDSAIQ